MMARQRRKGLSPRQKKILEVIHTFQTRSGYPPAIREICEQASISSTSVVNYYLDQLEEMGFIQRDQGVSRGIRLLEPAYEAIGASEKMHQAAETVREAFESLLKVPVMGRIVAGLPVPSFSYENPDSMVDVAASLLPRGERGEGLFALEVKGDSMIDAMVNDGDLVIMKPAKEAINGEMVAVWLDDRDETTLKYFYRETYRDKGKDKVRVRLQPANPTMDPIYINDPSVVRIQGKVVMVIRKVQGLAA